MNFYRLLLHLYPSSYRADYGEELAAILAHELGGTSGAARLSVWLAALADIVANSVALHWEIARRDLRYSVRSLLRTPGFTLTAVLLVAIGIGANAAVFALADFVLLRPLPFPQSDRLVNVWENHAGYQHMELSPGSYREIKSGASSLQSLAAYVAIAENLVGQGEPLHLDGAWITGNLFSTLGMAPRIGRYLNEDDDRPGAPGAVVLSYALWQAQFGGEPSVLGRSVNLDNKPYTIVGVMPPDFHFPERETAFWTAFRFQESDYQDLSNNYIVGLGRLKPGATLAQARNEASLVAAQLRQQYPKEMEGVGVSAVPMHDDDLSGQSKLLVKALCGAGICLLIITCANLANLLLTRALAKQKELSVRISLGANRRHILRQLVTESLLLAFVGGAAAVALAAASLPVLSRLVPSSLPTAEPVPPVDARLLLLALGLTVLTVVAFGVLPSIRICRGAGFDALRQGVRTGGVGNQRTRSALVIAEVVVSVVLLISSGLLIRALWKVRAVDPGFRSEGVLTLRTTLPLPKYAKTEVRAQYYQKVLDDVRRLPGVTHAGYITWLPMTMTGGIWPVIVPGEPENRAANNTASLRFVTPDFFATLQVPLLAGRDVSEHDSANHPVVAVVSESFAQRYWPNQQPLGRHFNFGLHDREVVGVVHDVRVRGLERKSEPQVYLPYLQVPDDTIVGYLPKDLAIRTTRGPGDLVPQVRQIIAAADPEQPISDVRTLEEIVAGQTESRDVQTRVLATFTALAVLLAGLGIYGLLSFAVSLRKQEFGIRVALGAKRGDIFGMVLGQGVTVAVAGLLPGLVLAYGAAKLMQSLLAGLGPADAETFAVAAAICFVTALLGTLLPALRAVRIDPTAIMRAE